MNSSEPTASGESPPALASPARDFHIVGVGASAGGLEALERLFERMPPQTGLAFVVVQHLSPDFKSLTDELLSRRTSIPIYQVEDGVLVEPDAMYLLPPKKDMILSDGRLLLTDKDPAQLMALPIDRFFRSLAQDAGRRAVGIILSGTGSDGSRGIRDIHNAGGLVIAQAPETAKFDGMPNSAVKTGVVDMTLPPEDIPAALLKHTQHPLAAGHIAKSPQPNAPLTGIDAIFGLLRDTYGIDFAQYKPETVTRRMERRLQILRVGSVDEYAQRLVKDNEELNQLYKDLLIGVTRFFRDDDAFTRIQDQVLPQLLQQLNKGEELRLWVAGCATGEEAYSLAILVLEAMAKLGRTVPVKIFATDVHRTSLDHAGVGIYDNASVTGLSRERLERFFIPREDGFQVSPDLRRLIVFAQHNVLKDAPFTKLDLITCRNLLIYFQPPAQKKVLSLFHFGLKTGGTLFLGPSESPGELSDEFEPVDARWKTYRKRRDVRLVSDLRMPNWSNRPRPITLPLPGMTANVPDTHLLGIYDAIIDESLPPSLLIGENRELIQSFGGASRYLHMRDGRFTSDVLEMVDTELRTALVGALPRAFREQKNVTYTGIRVTLANEVQLINIRVRPIQNRRSNMTYALVTIENAGPPAQLMNLGNASIDLGQVSHDQLTAMETELRYTKENLQAMIEELETSNEELQASNEELVASNEELQSTNEELHSVNEELYTVNAEFQKKIAELTELTTDIDNLLTSTEVHTIFLDRDLCIRKFTPKIAETFNLMPQDIGRPINNFTYTIDYPTLLEDVQQVLDKGNFLERQVRDRRGNWFLLRILPYRSGLSIAGVVLTLIDIARIKFAEAETRRKDEQLASILRNSPNWMFIKDLNGRYLLADEVFKRIVGVDPIGKTAHELFPRDVAETLIHQDDRVIREGVAVEAEVVIPHSDGPHTYLSIKFPIRDESGQMTGLGGIRTDVTQLKQAENRAREAVAQRDRFLAMLSHELRNPLAAILNAANIIDRLGNSPPETHEWFRIVARRARHMARLLDDLLDVARITQNKIEIRREPLDLTSIIRDVTEEVRGWYEEHRLSLHVRTAESPLIVEGDPARLQQMQVNLLMNAAKYTPDGGQVWYDLRRDGQQAVLSIRDTGVGMSREMLNKVFDLFVQADETLDRAGGGIGVGLTLVRSIVEKHGGTVTAHSEGTGRGSEFIVRIPLRPSANLILESNPDAIALPFPTTHSRRILIVEDDEDIRLSLKAILQMDGFQVQTVGDGLQALEVMAHHPPEVALVDVGIPGVDGYEVARRIRERYSPTQVRLIALTGYGRPSDRQAAFAAGFDAHLTKPFNPGELSRLIAKRDPTPPV